MAQIYLHFPQSKQNFIPEGEETIAGRLHTCNLPLALYFEKGDISYISGEHFKIYQDQTGKYFLIADLGSTNGTEVNGQLLAKNKSKTIRHGDIIRLAENDIFIIKVFIDEAETPRIPRKSGVYFDHPRSQFMVDGRPIPDDRLAPHDKKLLEYLYENAGEVCTHDELAEDVWLGAEVGNAAIAKAIHRLRQKLKRVSPQARHYIETIVGQGYKLQKAK